MTLRCIQDADLANRNVLVRVDFNVPLENGRITDDSRVSAAVPTIRHLIETGAIITVVSHLGRPKGEVVDSLRLKPVADRLSEVIDNPVTYVDQTVGERASEAISRARPGDVVLLENVRFDRREEENDLSFAKALSEGQDVFVNDAFGAAHRSHASTVGLASFLPAYAGLLMESELESLRKLIDNPASPFVAILGGAKVSDKLGVIEHLVEKVDSLLVGGGIANTFLYAKGLEIGASLAERDFASKARNILDSCDRNGVQLLLPVDAVVANSPDGDPVTVSVRQVPDDESILDIGSQTVDLYRTQTLGASTIFWNGPMGVFEKPAFSHGTIGVATAVADSDAFSVVGGGDSLAAIQQSGLSGAISHLSTGGGASLEFVEGKSLPGVEVLESKE